MKKSYHPKPMIVWEYLDLYQEGLCPVGQSSDLIYHRELACSAHLWRKTSSLGKKLYRGGNRYFISSTQYLIMNQLLGELNLPGFGSVWTPETAGCEIPSANPKLQTKYRQQIISRSRECWFTVHGPLPCRIDDFHYQIMGISLHILDVFGGNEAVCSQDVALTKY